MRSSLRTAESSGGGTSGYSNSSFGGYRASTGSYGSTYYGPQGISSGVSAMNASLQQQGRTNAIIHQEERTSGAKSLNEIWSQIAGETAAMRRYLVNEYSADF